MSNRGRSSSVPPARGRGSRSSSMPPEEHLGLGTMLPAPPRPPSSMKDSSGSITGQNEVVGGDTQNQGEAEGQNNLSTEEIVALDDDDAEENEQVGLGGKRKKRCTSIVWNYFTKKTVVVEVDGKKYEQLWGYCNFPKCKQKYRAESVHGTNAFRSHLRSCHNQVKGQLLLKAEKDRGKDVTAVQPFRYDLETSLKKFYLAVIMHEYPFVMVEHDYFVDFLKSLRPNFAFKSRVTARKDIMDIYIEEKDKLYAALKKVPCRFSATMDVWTSCQNKSYMCVTLHWIDDAWQIQKRIVALFHLEGRHTGHRLAEAFTEILVKWFVEKKIFALTLDNASNNLVAVTDIIDDLKLNGNGSLVCDGIFFHIRCACHILNLVARDGMAVISDALQKVKALVLTVKSSPLQWEELMKCATEFLAVVKKLYQFYIASKPASSSVAVNASPAQASGASKRYSELESFLYDDTGPDGSESNELDLYMAEPLLKQDSFDILAYWKNKTNKYPILSQIARDLMSIQVSTVASESAFSGAGRVLDPYRNRLEPEMVQALVCSKDWIHAISKDRKCIPSIVAELKSDEEDTISLAASAPLNDDSESDPDNMDDTGEL